MKCSKCYKLIPDKEEIRDDKGCYCEICHKSASWKRTGDRILSSFVFSVFVIFLIGATVYIWKGDRK